jgi:hypothetical protein
MSSPKEKAKELVDKYSTYVVMWSGGIEVETQNVKQCAFIAVDELIEEVAESADDEVKFMRVIYWEKVKQEINNL